MNKTAILISLLAALLIFGCAQQPEAGTGAAQKTALANGTSSITPQDEPAGTCAGSGNASVPGNCETDAQANASAANNPEEEHLLVSIVSFSTDKQTYGSSEPINMTVVLNSSGYAEELRVHVFGIKPNVNFYYINRYKFANVSAGENTVILNATTPYCTAGCAGVYPGPYELYAEVIAGSEILSNASTVITLVSGSHA